MNSHYADEQKQCYSITILIRREEENENNSHERKRERERKKHLIIVKSAVLKCFLAVVFNTVGYKPTHVHTRPICLVILKILYKYLWTIDYHSVKTI